MEQNTQALPDHVEEIVRIIGRLHADHRGQATRLERSFERATALLGRPAFLGVLTVLVLLWTGGNLILPRIGLAALDVPPFPWLEEALTLMALYMAALILTTQRRADQFAGHREQMTLQLAILSEQKAAKIIALVEECGETVPKSGTELILRRRRWRLTPIRRRSPKRSGKAISHAIREI
jgi:uncharacterized membrane protein